MNKILKSDLYRYSGAKGIVGLIHCWKYPGFRYTFYLRKAASCRKNSIKYYVYKYILRRLSFKFGFQIDPGTKIGKGLYFAHFGGIVVSVNAKIGNYCNIGHNVTIGKANRGKLKGYPEIGNFVWIGAGAVIVGNIKIGSNVLVAPNSFINLDVPDNSIVIGNPAKITMKQNATEGYINWVLED